MSLKDDIKTLRKTGIKQQVEIRLKEFQELNKKGEEDWFSELAFCILAANSKGKNAWAIQKKLGKNVRCIPHEKIRQCIIEHKHRFHNNKSRYIEEAKKHNNLKGTIIEKVTKEGQKRTREWLVKSIKGIGYKEASHFMRNIGYSDLAILDRHILNLMDSDGIIKKPKSLTPKIYLEIEKKFIYLAKELKMSPAELDLYMWYMKTGEVLK